MEVLRELGYMDGGRPVFNDPILPGDKMVFAFEEIEGKVLFGLSIKGDEVIILVKGKYQVMVVDLDDEPMIMVEEGGVVKVKLADIKILYMWADREGGLRNELIAAFYHTEF